jgi:endonuclease/exonuclease/phosphatase family metal-dependent hydrolase
MATDHLSYGTAVVARDHPIVAGGHTFARSGPWRKGLSWAHLPLGGHEITVLSVHLDPGNPATRLAQAQEIERCIDGPAIVMGDFNTDVSPVRTTAIDRLLHGVGLHTKQPALNTFPLLGRTLDWILVPPSLEILQVAALRDRVSDHRAVLADLRWIRPPAQPLAPPRC